MLKKTITYEDFNGQTVTEDFYFHLSKADLVEMEVERPGGLAAWLQSIVDSQDGKAIIGEFKKLILISYGKKSEDGKRFVKSEELRDEFTSTEAYSALFFELCTDTGAAAAFVNGIVPQGLEEEVAKMRAAAQAQESTTVGDETPAQEKVETALEPERPTDPTGLTATVTPRVLTQAEVAEMDSDELKSGLATGRYKFA